MSLFKLAKPHAKQQLKLVFEDFYSSVSNNRKCKGLCHVKFVHCQLERYSNHLSPLENWTGWKTGLAGILIGKG